MTYAKILSTGSYLPKKVLTNGDLAELVDTSDEWIRARTGIEQRHIAEPGETTVDLAEQAARNAIEAAGVPAQSIDLIVLATTTADQIFPSSACLLQQRLGIVGAPAFDVQAVCAGFVYALSVADNFIKAGSAKRALVIGAETFSRILNWQDRNTCVLFGDGAGAVILDASDTPGIYSTHLHADGRHAAMLQVPEGVSQGYDSVRENRAFVEMNGKEVFKFAVKALSGVVDEVMEANQCTYADIDWLVPHQANIRIISATAKKLGMSMDQVVVTVNQHGNTSAASIPLALDVAVRDGRIQRGQKLLLEGIGGGFAWGGAYLQY